MKTTLDLYATSDLYQAVVVSLFYPLDSIDKTNPQKAIFCFKREAGMDHLIAQYWARQLQVEPQALLNQLKAVKTRLYSNE